MREHHQRVVDRLVALLEPDERYLAMLLGGSIAKGREGENSDVDIMLIATDEEYQRRQATTQDFWYFNREICDYPDGYAEGKVLNLQFLRDVADHGSEPARSAFAHTSILFSRIPDLAKLIEPIPVYQESEQASKLTSFYSQLMLLTWFVGEAEKRNERYLLLQATADLVLYGGRLILAYNKILYPYHKWFMYELRRAPLKPEGLLELAEALLEQPTKARAIAFRDCIVNYRDWGITYAQAVGRFTQDSELNWRDGRPPLRDS